MARWNGPGRGVSSPGVDPASSRSSRAARASARYRLAVTAGFVLVLAGCAGRPCHAGEPARPAFEIYGYGAGTVGGRTGQSYRVTKRGNGKGPGTIRDAVSKPNRYITFDVSGDIVLTGDLNIEQPHITIDGSSAPNGGVQFRGGWMWNVRADEIVIRHVRIRPGPNPDGGPLQKDCLTIERGRNIVIDHVSCSWGTDENLSMATAPPHRAGPEDRIRDVTVQYSIVSEELGCPDNLKPACETAASSMGSLFAGDLDRISLYRNLYAHNVGRNPQVGGTGRPGEAGRTRIELIQNVIYHYLYGFRMAAVSPTWEVDADVVNNAFVWGPTQEESGGPPWPGRTTGPKVPIERLGAGPEGPHRGALRVYLSKNSGHRRKRGDPECTLFQTGTNAPCDGASAPPGDVADTPIRERRIQELSEPALLDAVLEDVGATLPCRDAVDARVVRDVRNRSGRWVDDPRQVGGWANLDLPCSHENEPPKAAPVRTRGRVEAAIFWSPDVADPDRAPLSSLTCRIVPGSPVASRAQVANDCSSGRFDPKGLKIGSHRFEYEAFDGRDPARAEVVVLVY